MKSLFKIVGLLCVASMCAGFAYAHYRANNQYEVLTFHDHLCKGESIESVGSNYYNPNEDNRSYAEFRDDLIERNKLLTANGRIPQIGDVVCIEVHAKKK